MKNITWTFAALLFLSYGTLALAQTPNSGQLLEQTLERATMPSNPAKPFLVPRRDDPQLQRVNESIARLAAVRPAGDAFSAFALAAHLADLAIEA